MPYYKMKSIIVSLFSIAFIGCCIAILFTTFSVFAQGTSEGIVVTADTKNANPTLIFNGGLRDQALSAKIT